MSRPNYFFKKKQRAIQSKGSSAKTSGALISEVTGDANLVDGKQTWELAEYRKHDLEAMKSCCEIEIKKMDIAGQVPAPYYF